MAGGHSLVFLSEVVGAENENLASGVLVAGIVSAVGLIAVSKLKGKDEPIIPDDKLTIRNFVELITSFIVTLGDTVMGKENRKYVPFAATIFFYLLFANLLGLIPGFAMPTDHVAFNLGVALVVFIMYNFWGIREVGLIAYLKHFCGPILLMAPLMILIELVGHVARPLSLSLRLFGNMTGDHLVLAVFTDLTKVVIPVIFYGLGTFVSFMQAFVFTLLTMVYIRFAVAHDEEH